MEINNIENNKYKNGKIYKLIDNTNNNIYIGSTINTIEIRLLNHINAYNRYLNDNNNYFSSFEIIKNGNYKIELLLLYPCNNKKELEHMENYYIRNLDCINKNIAGRTQKEYYQDNKEKIKEYYQDNKEKIKEYYQENKEHKKKYNKKYREENKEKIKEKIKEYYQNNKEKIIKQRSELNKKKYTCECGKEASIGHKTRHEKSKYHINFIQSNNK